MEQCRYRTSILNISLPENEKWFLGDKKKSFFFKKKISIKHKYADSI
jgi:hypothetical protein